MAAQKPGLFFFVKGHVLKKTRMRSSRMRTTRNSSHRGSVSVHAGIHTPWVWAWRPPWCGPGDPLVLAWRPSWPDPSNSPRVWAWKPARHGGIPPLPPETSCKACWDTPPVNRITDTCKNITLPQPRCGW